MQGNRSLTTLNRAKSKLASNRGASITYALLVFLVCAALSAVIVVAGTTASGRMAKLAETDQRYYAVTSAAEFLSDEIGKGTVSKVKLSNGNVVTFAKPMNEVTDSDLNYTLGDGTELADNETLDPDEKDISKPTDDDSDSLIAKIFAAGASTEFKVKADDLPDVIVKVESTETEGDVTRKYVSLDCNGFKMYMKFSVHEQPAKPPVTKLADGTKIADGNDSKEISWDLVKIMTSYEYSNEG